MAIPNNYQQVMPYLIVKNADQFIQFVRKAFDAKETYRAMRDENCIMHAEIMIGRSTIMLADATEKYQPRPGGLFVYVDNADDRYQKAIAEGAESLMLPSDQTYGRSAGVLDAFGNSWWLTSTPVD
jgi:PhnB protein